MTGGVIISGNLKLEIDSGKEKNNLNSFVISSSLPCRTLNCKSVFNFTAS